jgi:anthranilate synthase component II
MKIGFIDNFDSFVYNLVRYVREITDGEVCIQRNNEINFEELDSCDAILLSPGPGIPEEAGKLMKVIDRFHLTKPILGVCLGHQALGEFFHNELISCNEPIHGKSSLITVENTSTLFQNLEKEIEVGRYHSWQIQLKESSVLTATARTLDGTLMAFEHQSKPIYGVQFHPESILTPSGRKIIENWTNSVRYNMKKHEKDT